MSTVLIIGASRGLGLEFARQYAAEGERVIGTVRREPDGDRLREFGARPLTLDLDRESSIGDLWLTLSQEPIDIVIINAGLYGPRTEDLVAPERADFDAVMHTNVWAPMQLIPALAPGLERTGGRLTLLTSRMGSIGQMTSSAGWLYRASKAAANAVLKAASLELGPRGVTCLALHPGWVRTDMGGPQAEIDALPSVLGMRQVIAAAGPEANGRFFDYTGAEIAW